MENSQDKMSFMDFRFGVNFATWLFHTLAITLNVFTHFGLGERSIGIPGVIAILPLLFYAAVFEKYNSGPMGLFIFLYIVMCCFWQTYAWFRREILKRIVHTRYSGKPYLCLLVPRWDEVIVKRIEPLIVIALSFFVMKWNIPLGFYLMIAAFGQGGSLAISRMIKLNRQLDAMDNMIDQQQNAEDVRAMQGQ